VTTNEVEPSSSEREIKTGWDEFLFWGERFFTDPVFEEDERIYKLRAVTALVDVRNQLESGGWMEPLRLGLTNKDSNPVAWQAADDFRSWAAEDSEAAAGALSALWTDDHIDGPARVDAFDALVPAEVVGRPGGLVNVAAYLLGAIDPIQWPNFRITAVERAYELTRFPNSPEQSSPGEHYGHALSFFDAMLEEAKVRGIPMQDRLDAQGVMWVIAGGGIENGPYKLTPSELAEFTAYFNIPAALRKAKSAKAKSATKPKSNPKPTRGFCPLCASDERVQSQGPDGDRWRFVCTSTIAHLEPLEFHGS
jgi:hypothetical protein